MGTRKRVKQTARDPGSDPDKSLKTTLLDWAIKGVVGGSIGLIVTFGVQQIETIRERQRLATLLLPEIAHNSSAAARVFEIAKSLPPGAELPEVTFERRVYESALSSLGVLPPDLVRQIYDAYVETAVITVTTNSARRAGDRGTTAQSTSPIDKEDVIRKQLGPAVADDFDRLPAEAQRRLWFQAELKAADEVNARSVANLWKISILLLEAQRADWDSLMTRLREQATPRWWLNWLE